MNFRLSVGLLVKSDDKMKLISLKENLKNLITSNRLSDVFSNARIYISTSEIEKNLTLIESRYRKICHDHTLGVITDDKFTVEETKTKKALLDLIDALKSNDLKPSIVTEKNYKRSQKEVEFIRHLKVHGDRRRLKSLEGNYTYKREFVRFRQSFLTLLDEYAKLSHYKYKAESIAEGIECEIGPIMISVMYSKKGMHVTVSKAVNTDEGEKGTADMLTLEYDDDGTLNWVGKRSGKQLKYSNIDIAKILLHEVFERLMNY